MVGRLIRRGTAKRKHDARIAWLTPRLAEYADVPGMRDDVTDAGRLALDRLVAAMRTADVFGASRTATQRDTARRLLTELRGEARDVGDW